jgi:endo-1,4-beta-xylanase
MQYGIKDAWPFRVGAAVSGEILRSAEASSLLTRHFSSLTPENAMKFGNIHPQENGWAWEEADQIADFAREEGFAMRGHTILWHNQTPPWLFRAGDDPVSKNELYKRLENHIAAVTERYNDAVYVWDVLNEVIDTDGEDGFRLSEWYKIGGREIYDFAFRQMRQASPNAKLFYNDYNIESGGKMESTVRFLSSLLDAGVPVQGVGIQGHWYYDYPDEKTVRTAIECYAALGLEIEFTEVDISVYQFNDRRDKADYFTSPPEDRLREQGQRYKTLFAAAAQYPAVKNITIWGIADNHTWLDNFPVKERKNWPLLFDEQYREKPAVAELAYCT